MFFGNFQAVGVDLDPGKCFSQSLDILPELGQLTSFNFFDLASYMMESAICIRSLPSSAVRSNNGTKVTPQGSNPNVIQLAPKQSLNN